jgi:hypothetical protein
MTMGIGFVRGEEPNLALSGSIQIHGERLLTTATGTQPNLDVFWGRINVGLDFKDDRLQSKILARIYPEGFGFEPVTKVNFDTNGQGSVKTASEAQSKFVLPNAWVKYTFEDVAFRVGRMEIFEAPSMSYGSYLDGGTSGKFYSRGPATDYNALEAVSSNSGFTSSMMLAATDKSLNTGLLRIQEKYAHSSGASVAGGYRVNVFDKWQFPDADLLHRFDVTAAYSWAPGWQVFAEWASLERASLDNEMPILAGVQLPVTYLLDQLSLEVEYLDGRTVLGEDKPVFINLYARKKFFGRLNFDLDFYSDSVRPDFMAMGIGGRMTSTLK